MGTPLIIESAELTRGAPLLILYSEAQSRQRAKFFLQPSELELPQPLTRRRVWSPLWFRGEGHTRWRERCWGVPIPTRGHTLWYSLYSVNVLCALWSRFKEWLLERKAWTGCLVATLQPFLLVLPGAPDLESALHAGGRAPASLLLPLLALTQHLLRIKDFKYGLSIVHAIV